MLRLKSLAAVLLGGLLVGLPASALAGHDHDADDNYYARPNQPHDNGWHKGWYKHHHGPVPADYDQACDGDGDECRAVPNVAPTYQPWEHNYVCDADGDDCHWANNWAPNYWHRNGGYNYGAPYSWYQASPPSNWNLVQQRNWLISRRHHAMEVMAKMRARGDRDGTNRMLGVYNNLNSRINRIDRQVGRQ
jgi:hypothetical protein